MNAHEIAYEIACTVNANDKGNGTMFAVPKLYDSICFNERNHPNGLHKPFMDAIHDLLDKGLITREYKRSGRYSGYCYYMTNEGRSVLRKTVDIKI